ncbi:helix-turn-helix domain-containing protein [Ruania alkalisoli]|uniref:Helix-turn-helix domain-containing protein n=1 Tax=Ruania alkalisoli TaxID=2779775 RepID=A0A7M1SWK1_9MICO|nr:helix-turn-helix domain-containing protein [Ruania alkalisoli]QOR71960.1 helix-turn-helix domain-containing protein [Ruania alkalisoli]
MTTKNYWLTPAELGDYLGVSRQTLANWRSSGTGPAFAKRGKVVRYRQSDADAWLESTIVATA